jgi:hypothetical protein
MNTKQRLLTALLAISAMTSVGCTYEDTPIRLLNARPVSGEPSACSPGDIAQYTGSLDASGQGSYLIAFNTESNIQSLSTSTGGVSIAGPDRNDFLAKEMLLTYTSNPALPFEQEIVPVWFVIRAGASGDGSWIIVDLLGPKAAETLAGGVGAEPVQLTVSFQLAGELYSGQKVRSSTASFPITVTNSGFAGCAAGDRIAPTGPCGSGGGQDGARIGCCSDPAFADVCG